MDVEPFYGPARKFAEDATRADSEQRYADAIRGYENAAE
jgi:hypothetical protein